MDDKMEAFEKVHEKIKFKSFGKVKIGKSYREKVGQVIKDPKEQFEEEEAKASKEIDQINKMKLSNIGKVWEIRRRIVGGKKANIEATAITNPDSGKLVVSKDNIKKVTLKYCIDTLSSNIPEKEYQKHIEDKRKHVNNKLLEVDGSFAPLKETFECL